MPNRILVAEDDESIRKIYSDVFSLEGYSVIQAKDGAEAVAYLDKNPEPCVVITDLYMPKFNGLELIEFIKKSERKDTPVILVTASNERLNLPKDVELIRKPVDLEVLLNAASKHCHN